MYITPESFSVWTGFEPGPEFRPSPFNFQDPNAWYRRVPANTQTQLAPAIPVVQEGEPDAEYWRTEVSRLEWNAVSPLWIGLGKTILRYDPYFNPFRNDWFVDQQGNWTKQFREHSLFSVMATELGARMRETMDWTASCIRAVNNPTPSPPPQPPAGAVEDTPQEQQPIAEGLWSRLGSWAGEGFRWGKLFTPEGLGWTVAFEAAKWGYHRYENYHEQRERQREKHRHNRNAVAIELGKAEGIDFEAAWAEVPDIPGFAANEYDFYGLLVTKAPVQTYDWQQSVSGPECLVSHDGVYQ